MLTSALRSAIGKEARVGVYRTLDLVVEFTGRVTGVGASRFTMVVTKPTPMLMSQHLVRRPDDEGIPLHSVAWVDVDGTVKTL